MYVLTLMVLPNGSNGFYQKKNRSSIYRQRKYRNYYLAIRFRFMNPFSRSSYDAGINTFDTANARLTSSLLFVFDLLTFGRYEVYSNEQSEIILGRAIKQLNLPRDEIVVMTKVCVPTFDSSIIEYLTSWST